MWPWTHLWNGFVSYVWKHPCPTAAWHRCRRRRDATPFGFTSFWGGTSIVQNRRCSSAPSTVSISRRVCLEVSPSRNHPATRCCPGISSMKREGVVQLRRKSQWEVVTRFWPRVSATLDNLRSSSMAPPECTDPARRTVAAECGVEAPGHLREGERDDAGRGNTPARRFGAPRKRSTFSFCRSLPPPARAPLLVAWQLRSVAGSIRRAPGGPLSGIPSA